MLLRIILLLTLVLPFAHSPIWSSESQNKIVYLISGPRALSTVFLRMMESRGDFTIYHEPTVPLYDFVHHKELTKDWFRRDATESFDEVKKNIYASQKSSHVFVKDMSVSTYEYLLQDKELMENPSAHFLFLVRNPHHSSISLYNRHPDPIPDFGNFVGLKRLYEEYRILKKASPNSVKIIFSEQLYQTPRLTMMALCRHLKIPFSEKMFQWKKHDPQFKGYVEWNEQKVGDHIHHWHGRAITSTNIGKPNTYEVDQMGKPTFSEISNTAHRKKMIKFYEDNLVYYKKFLDSREDFLIR